MNEYEAAAKAAGEASTTAVDENTVAAHEKAAGLHRVAAEHARMCDEVKHKASEHALEAEKHDGVARAMANLTSRGQEVVKIEGTASASAADAGGEAGLEAAGTSEGAIKGWEHRRKGFEMEDRNTYHDGPIVVGMRVEAGEGEDHDTGVVDSISGDTATVRWDSLVVTSCPIANLRTLKHTYHARSGIDVAALDCAATGANEMRSLVAEAKNVIMFMPAGVHQITPSQNGRPTTVTVRIDAASADEMEQQRKALTACGKKPYFGIGEDGHKSDKAGFWPTRFFWDKLIDATGSLAEGVWAEGDWTKSGSEAVEGRDVRTFSPTFFVDEVRNDRDDPCRVVCNPDAKANMGGFLNDAAFQLSPLWARNAGDGTTKTNKTGDQTMETKVETVAELQARNKTLEQKVAELQAKDDAVSKAELRAAQSELREIKGAIRLAEREEKFAAIEARETERKDKDAEAAVQSLVESGEIAVRDSELQAQYKAKFVADPSLIPLMCGKAKGTGGGARHLERETPGANARQVQVDSYGKKDLHGGLKQIGALSCASGKGTDLAPKFKAALEISGIYKREVQPLLAKGVNDFPLEAAAAADTLGTLAGTLVALRTLDLYKFEFPMLDSITTDFSDQPAQFNQTTSTRIIVVPAVISYDATLGSDGRPAGWMIVTPAQTTDANITLNRHRAVDIVFDANVLASTQRRLFVEQGPAAAYAIGKDVVDYLYTLITQANFGDNPAFSVNAINFGRPTFSKAKRILNLQGVPFTNRFALSNSVYQEQLEQDPTLVSLAVFQKPEIITDSELPQIARFRPIEAPNLPATAIALTGGTLAAFFAHKSALLMQARIPNDWNQVLGGNQSYGSVNVVTNPDTGLSVLMVQFSNPQSSHAEYRLALMYGAAKGNGKGGQIVTT